MDAIDLRECQHDPPCGAPYCSACELLRMDTKLRTALEALSEARWFPITGCFSGDCPHTHGNECAEIMQAEAEKLSDQIQAAIDAAERSG